MQLALEYMETAWSILDQYSESPASYDDNNKDYTAWAKEQAPRFLTGIGDVLLALQRHADATDAYCRALGHRQEQFSDDETGSLNFLQCQRRLVETNVLIAEELLACPPDQDIITTESQDVLVKAPEQVDYARGYYDQAWDELQETVLLMGALAAKGIDLGGEKENVCFAATLVMGVGTNLAEIDEKAAADADLKEPSKQEDKEDVKWLLFKEDPGSPMGHMRVFFGTVYSE